MKPEKERAQLSLLTGDEYEYFFFVTNIKPLSGKIVTSCGKRGNSENFIKEANMTGTPHHVLIMGMVIGHLFQNCFGQSKLYFR